MGSPEGELTFDAPAVAPRSPRAPVGELTFEAPTRRDEDTLTFESEMMFNDAVAEEEKFLSGGASAPQPAEAPNVTTAINAGFREKLVLEEGEEFAVYQGEKDKPGVLTAGIGHKLTPEELKSFSKGDAVTPEQVEAWYEQDSKKAIGAAVSQSQELGVDSVEFMSALASVNFQLGVNWKGEHTETWRLMKEGKFEEAAEEAADSEWNTQTPSRVRAFQDALRSL